MSNGKELLKLIKENPNLPIVPMVGQEVVADDSYGQTVVDFTILENLAKQFGVEIKE